jgi:hypothetical protein
MSKRNGWLVGSAVLGAAGLLFMFFGTVAIAAAFLGGGGAGRASGGVVKTGFDGDRPVGLYFMTRFWSFTGTLEKAAWYFAPDGSVYQNLEHGFSEADLQAHPGPRGTYSVDGGKMTITWADGKSTTNDVERDGQTFTWDMGIFSPVKPFDDEQAVAGAWEGGESLTYGGNHASVARTLRLGDDGTFQWDSISFLETGNLSGSAEGGTTGKWELAGVSLTLTDQEGRSYRGIAFPFDDGKQQRLFFGGTMYKRVE